MAGNQLQVESIALNEEVPLWKYFAPGWHRGFQLVLLTALAAAGLEGLRRLVQAVRSPEKPASPGPGASQKRKGQAPFGGDAARKNK